MKFVPSFAFLFAAVAFFATPTVCATDSTDPFFNPTAPGQNDESHPHTMEVARGGRKLQVIEVAGGTTYPGYVQMGHDPWGVLGGMTQVQCYEWCRDEPTCKSADYIKSYGDCWPSDKGDMSLVTPDSGSDHWVKQVSQATGDPHFRTWKQEHFEFHGQCDIVMTKVKDFAGPKLDLDIHLRTSLVRYWSYIKSVAIRIGNDILEVEGSAEKEDGVDKRHYRINYEYRGPLKEIGGFPVTISPRNNMYTIDLDSKFPGQKIQIKTFKEFVGVKIIGASQESFGNAVGITGNFQTGKTLARDGVTVLHDFNDLGLEWQVLPSDGKLFHEVARPQFPELCYLPEDPRGDRARRLAESDITEEAAEAACAGLKDDFDRKGCIYDILATQDLDMVGAY